MTIASLNEVYSWVVSTLQNDTTLSNAGFTKVYNHQAPEDAPFPYIIVQKQTGNFEFALGNMRVFDTHWVSIKAVSRATVVTSDGGKAARDADVRIRELLSLQFPTLSSGKVMHIDENSCFETREAETGNEIFYHVGTVYRIMLAH